MQKILSFAIASVMATALPANAADFVLDAAKWGAKQNAAVQAAGGTLIYSHPQAGIGVVSSANPDFLAQALGSNAFQAGAEDMLVQWTPPTQSVEASAITPGDEGFFVYQWNMLSMNAPAAWALGCTGAGVRVAIIDGGIAADHVDIAANLDVAASTSFVPGQTFDTDTGVFWHGTHVAGIVAAPDNGIGTLGVAPEATLIGVKVLHGGSGTFGAVIAGILYAATPQAEGGAGADILNLSLGAVFPKNAVGGGPLVAAMNKAVNYANRYGALVVSAAGNAALDLDHSGNLVSVPAESGAGVAVSATGPVGGTNFRRPASYTNYGNSAIHVAAPGGDFTLFPSAGWFFDMVLSPGGPGNAYFFAAGTSMASPAAAGVAALIKQVNPGISLGALKSRLAQTADDEGANGHDPFYGHGFVNAYQACID